MLSFGNREKNQPANLFKRAIIVAGFGGLTSMLLEISQYYLISGRQSSLFDWIFNTLGTLVGSAMYIFIDRK
jgi:VanZ family protein